MNILRSKIFVGAVFSIYHQSLINDFAMIVMLSIIFYYKYRFCIYPVTYTFWHSLTCITLCCKNENMPWIFLSFLKFYWFFFGGKFANVGKEVCFADRFSYLQFFSIQRSLLEFRKQKKSMKTIYNWEFLHWGKITKCGLSSCRCYSKNTAYIFR